jgi:hypothetical protein
MKNFDITLNISLDLEEANLITTDEPLSAKVLDYLEDDLIDIANEKDGVSVKYIGVEQVD